MKRLLLLSIICLALFLGGCMGIVAHHPRPKAMLGPDRTVRGLLVYDSFTDLDHLLGVIKKVDEAFYIQTGIRHEIVLIHQITRWKKSGMHESIRELYEIVQRIEVTEELYIDQAYGVGQSTWSGVTSCLTYGLINPAPSWSAAMSMRYMRIKDPNDIFGWMSDWAHPFISLWDHGSEEGLMAPAAMYPFPSATWIGDKDLETLLANKYMDFPSWDYWFMNERNFGEGMD